MKSWSVTSILRPSCADALQRKACAIPVFIAARTWTITQPYIGTEKSYELESVRFCFLSYDSLLFVHVFFKNILGVLFIFSLQVAKNLLSLRGNQDSLYGSGGHFVRKLAFLL
jgi:hypothetical protein